MRKNSLTTKTDREVTEHFELKIGGIVTTSEKCLKEINDSKLAASTDELRTMRAAYHVYCRLHQVFGHRVTPWEDFNAVNRVILSNLKPEIERDR
jgi:hypothetical protein